MNDETISCEKSRHLERGTCMYPMAEFLREKRLRWFVHVQRRDKDKDKDITNDGERNSRQSKAEMARPGERDKIR